MKAAWRRTCAACRGRRRCNDLAAPLPTSGGRRWLPWLQPGTVATSSRASQVSACSRDSPHISGKGLSEAQTAGRSGWPKTRQRCCVSSCTQRLPAGLPCGMPGMGEVIEGAVQHAPQAGRQSMRSMLCAPSTKAIVVFACSCENNNHSHWRSSWPSQQLSASCTWASHSRSATYSPAAWPSLEPSRWWNRWPIRWRTISSTAGGNDGPARSGGVAP